MRPRDWLLLLIGLDADEEGLDPIRVQKGMFLLAREGGLPQRERYWFVAYNYGPMSPRLYRDLEALVRLGLVERVEVEGYGWRPVVATEAGAERVRELVEGADRGTRATIERLREIKAGIVRLTFAELLRDIYARYPAYAARSVFRRR